MIARGAAGAFALAAVAALCGGLATGAAEAAMMAPPAWPATPPAPGGTADRIVVHKARHTLTLYRDGRVLRAYRVALGRGGLAPKTRQGDKRTPEGLYTVTAHNAQSAYHLSLRISYPSVRDVAAAEARGVAPGGDIMIHGIKNGYGWLGARHRETDWTAGCIAVTDREIEEIARLVPDGTPIEIEP